MKYELISLSIENKIAVLTLKKSIINEINIDLVSELIHALEKVKNDTGIRGLVLSSQNEKFFSIGFDIPNLIKLGKEDFAVFYKAFNQLCISLYTLPKPTTTAITGHAIAGGCILALCCDYRIIAEGHKLMGLNEIKLGVSVPYPADRILRDLVGARAAQEIMETGKFYSADELLKIGMVDQVVSQSTVVSSAIERSKIIGAMPESAFALIKRNRIEPVVEQISKSLEEKEALFVDLWFSDPAQKLLNIAIENF